MATTETWTKTGETIFGKPVDDGEARLTRERIVKAIENMEWQTVPCRLGAGPGLAIEAAIREFRIPKVSHVATTNDLAPYGFYAIRGHYKNGTADIYILDMGSELATIRSDFTPIKENT